MDTLLDVVNNTLPELANNITEPLPWYDAYKDEEQTFVEEVLNTVTHAIGLSVIIPAVSLLILLARTNGNIWHVIGVSCYSFSLIIMYTCSTLYHWSGIADISMDLKDLLRDLDHCAIYFLIAGTYTPLILVNLIYNTKYCPANSKTKHVILKEAWTATLGSTILVLIYIMGALGVTLKLMYGSKGLGLFMGYGFYLVMGWLAIFTMRPLSRQMPKNSFRLLIIGGLFYTTGMIFLLSDTLPFNHPVWHMFVFSGSVLHFFSITAATIPLKSDNTWKTMEKRNSTYSAVDFLGRFVATNVM